MALIPVDKNKHAKMRLKPLQDFGFLASFPVVEVVIGEFSNAAANFPIFFLEREGLHTPVALLSLTQNDNMFVEADGAWSGHYMPAAFRRYPFSVQPGEFEGQQGPVLMIEEDMLSDEEGEPLYAEDEKDEANSPVGRVIRLIAETDRHHQATRAMVAELKEAGVIRTADLQIQMLGQRQNITGLFGVDEQKLAELSDEAFLKLRKSGALALAHMQMLSVGQVQRLISRHTLRDEAKKRGITPPKPIYD